MPTGAPGGCMQQKKTNSKFEDHLLFIQRGESEMKSEWLFGRTFGVMDDENDKR